MATLAVFWRLSTHGFINLDDAHYVIKNPHVKAGLTKKGVIWAFTTFHAANWHPLTWLSHMLDCQIYGSKPGGHHFTNVLFHIANTLLLFLVFNRMTRRLWPSAFVAALFALHPLHVESVAWVAERKDVLSTFFWMLTMWTYVRYTESPGIGRYLSVLFFFALGLMAKPMLVTLPFVLLLLDYWPLGRFGMSQSGDTVISQNHQSKNTSDRRWLVAHPIREKVPFLALSVLSSVITLVAQQSGEAVARLDVLPLGMRIANALVAYVSYVGKMIWPQHLAVFYPYLPSELAMWRVAGSGLLLVSISALLMRAARRYRCLVTGWLWYLGTLVPVIGLVQVGAQSMADRYTYVPLIGLFVMVAWGVSGLTARWRYRRMVLAMSTGMLLSGLTIGTWLQVGHWKTSITLWKHALNVTDNNFDAHNGLARALADEGKLDEAIGHFSKALSIDPDLADAHNGLGGALAEQGKLDEAMGHFSKALSIDPDFAEAHNNVGSLFSRQGKLDEAIGHFLQALRIEPDFAGAHTNLGIVLAYQKKFDEAIGHFSEALRIEPDLADAHNGLGRVLADQGKLDEAIGHFSKALSIDPDFAEAHNGLGGSLAHQGKLDEAMGHFSKAVRIKPDYAQAHYNLGLALAEKGRFDEAIGCFSKALEIKPDYAQAQYNLKALQAARKPETVPVLP